MALMAFRQRNASVSAADIVHAVVTGLMGSKPKESAETCQLVVGYSFKFSCF